MVNDKIMANKIIITESQFNRLFLTENRCHYLNMDVSLPSAGRTAPKMSEKDFTEKIKSIFEKESDRRFGFDSFLYTFCGYADNSANKQIKKDLSKVKVDSENVYAIGKVHMTKSGIPYLMGYKGGDWEVPVLFMVYWDGSKLRAYIPTYGNSFDRKRMTALGNDEKSDHECISKGTDGKAYQNDEVTYNKEACIKDFEARIKVK